MYKGLPKIKTELGTNIDSYIMKWTREYMFRYVREMFNPVRLPVGKINSARKLDKLVYKNNGNLEDAIDEYLEDETVEGVKLAKKKSKLKKLHTTKISVNSIHTFEKDDEGSEVEIKDSVSNGLEYVCNKETRDEISVIADKCLTDTEKYVLFKHYGLGSFSKSTYQDIANDLKVTRMRVCQIAKKALNKMKRQAISRGYNNNNYEV
jgi:RNA polymerase sigma factor (sigma-70 family)